ncbi:MAG: hypothetical protein KGN76_00230 [Acidobacteriota bacterium]|nr:hypothetical protein [Acidobacteriota bacterium]
MTRYFRLLVPVAVVATVAACTTAKSANPLSPSVAGPIPGVSITAPKVVSPSSGAEIAVSDQPITLKVQNATTNGVRPLYYSFDVASDSAFSHVVFSTGNVKPGTGGDTSVTLSDTLGAEQTYYWRAQALDGANTGPYMASTSFTVYTPVVINAPTPVSPTGGTTVTSTTPALVVTNATHTGPAGALTYTFQIAQDQAFSTGLVSGTVAEGTSQTQFTPASALAYSTTFYWRARAADPSHTGGWSQTESFVTPAAPTTGGGGGGTGGGGSGGGSSVPGGFDLNSVQIVGGSPDIRSWQVTAQITSLSFSNGSININYTKNCQWPSADIGGGTLQEATIWIFEKIGGQWYGTGGERLRPCQTSKDLTNPSDIATGWFYSGQWAPMTGYVPAPGEVVGFMVTDGSTRADNNAPVHERSGVVLVGFPANGVSTSYPPFLWQEP